MELSGKQRRYLRAIGHGLRAVVQIGKDGVSEAVTETTSAQLECHELIKVKVLGDTLDRHEAAADLAAKTGSEVAQVLGKTFLLYRKRNENPTISLPA